MMWQVLEAEVARDSREALQAALRLMVRATHSSPATYDVSTTTYGVTMTTSGVAVTTYGVTMTTCGVISSHF